MKNKTLEKNINYLGLDDHINEVLHNNNINYISDLWVLSRKNLKQFSLNDKEINNVIVKLQLNGLDLNHKKY